MKNIKSLLKQYGLDIDSWSDQDEFIEEFEQYVIKEIIDEYNHQFLSKKPSSAYGVALQDFVFERTEELKKKLIIEKEGNT